MSVSRPRVRALRLVVFALLALAARAAAAAPPEVQSLGWCAGRNDCLTWNAVSGADKYRLYRGEGAGLPCVLNPSLDSCAEGVYVTATTGNTIVELPAPGTMFWFLVTAVDGSGEGSPGSATAGPRALDTTGTCAGTCSPAGAACATNNDCCSANCNGVCQSNCCQADGGTCSTNAQCCGGACVAGVCGGPCTTASDCPGSDTACSTRTCVAGSCGTTNAPYGTVTPTQTAGDCQQQVCDGQGGVTNTADNNDVPVDGNQCTNDSCLNGVPSNIPAPTNLACSQNGGVVCDGSGRCVQCNQAVHCPGSDTECAYRTCTANTCGTGFAPQGTLSANQVPGDCQDKVCDGAGNLVSVVDNLDIPFDGNQCTSDICSGGAPAFVPSPPGTACNQNGGVTCNGFGQCVQCNVAADCPGSDTECRQRSCTANTCGFNNTAAGTTCTGGNCDGNGNCLAPAPQVLATTPADGGTAVASTTVAVTFSTAMNPATLTAQTAAGACGGSIQVSLDGFASCIAFSAAAPAMTGGNTVATLVPAPGLLVNRTFRIRVTTAAQSGAGVPLASPYTHGTGFTTSSPNLCDGSLVISQVYGAGGLGGAAYRNDFVELHNRGTAAASVAGMSIQYASATGTNWLVTNLSGTVPAGGYYLVQLFSGGTNGSTLPTPDATGTTDMSSTTGKVALVSNTTALGGTCPVGGTTVVDFVGYGSTANCNEGGANAPAPSAANSAQRAVAGCADVNANGSDFTAGAPSPRNTGAAPAVCACVARNESNAPAEADWCVVQFPPSLTLATGVSTGPIYGDVYEAGVTEPAGPASGVRAQLGWGPATANPQYEPAWKWFNAAFNVQSGNNDEYQASFTTPAPGSYRYAYRVSVDSGVSWTICDANQADGGAGANAGLTFDIENEAVLTVTP